MANTNDDKARLKRRKDFKAWRKIEGLSYQKIVEKGNAKAVEVGLCLPENPTLTYPTVSSWGTRGAVPCDDAAKVLSLLWPGCPLIKGRAIPA